MDVGLTLESDEQSSSRIDAILGLADHLKSFFATREYGEDIKVLVIGLILVDQGAVKLHPARPLKYRRSWVFKPTPKSVPKTFTNLVEYDIKLDKDLLSQLNPRESSKYLAGLVLGSLELIRARRKAFPTFDIERFEHDLKMALEDYTASTASVDLGLSFTKLSVQAPAQRSPLSIEDFPKEALALVQRELPVVQMAVAKKDRELLRGILTRVQAFSDRWDLCAPLPQEMNPYAEYASLVVKLLREGMLELMAASDEERARLHERFRKEVDARSAALAQGSGQWPH